MIELLFVTCMAAEPSNCQDRSLLFTEEIGLMTCMVHAQGQLAGWVASHPRETIREWRCQKIRAGKTV